jgi:hypothetical protein
MHLQCGQKNNGYRGLARNEDGDHIILIPSREVQGRIHSFVRSFVRSFIHSYRLQCGQKNNGCIFLIGRFGTRIRIDFEQYKRSMLH